MEIFDIVDRICREHHINYSLCVGFVVGAHLYKGILPWDDDIDIDVYDKVPEGILKNIDLFLCKRILTIDKGEKAEKGMKNILRNLALDTVLSNRRLFLLFFQKIVEILSHVSSDYTYRELFGAYHYYNMIPYQASIFENYTTIEFENRKAMIVRDYIDYLRTRYNRTDFHEPKEKQVTPHIKFIDLNTPYKNYM